MVSSYLFGVFPQEKKKWEANVSNNKYHENYNLVIKNKIDFLN